MRTTTRLALLVALTAFVASACSTKSDEIESTIQGYVAADRTGDGAATKPFVVEEDRKVLENSKSPRLLSNLADTDLLRQKLERFVTVQIKSVETEDGEGTVEATVEAPSGKQVDEYLVPKVMTVAKKYEKDEMVVFRDEGGETLAEETEIVTRGDGIGGDEEIPTGETGSFKVRPLGDWTDDWSGDADIAVDDFRFAESGNSG